MTVTHYHMVACGESEGEDWDDMRSWTYDYLPSAIPPGGQVSFEVSPGLADGCYVVLPVYDDGPEISEKVWLDGDTEHVINIG